MKTLVWRVECKHTGLGIYRSEELFAVSDIFTKTDQGKHPLPVDEMPKWNMEVNQSRFRFGFPSLDKLFEWIDSEEWRYELAIRDAVLKVYEVDITTSHVSKNQIAFIYRDAVEVGVLEYWDDEETTRSYMKELVG